MNFDPELKEVTAEFNRISLDNSEPAASVLQPNVSTTHLKQLGLLPANAPDTINLQIHFPAGWYEGAFERINTLFQASIQGQPLLQAVYFLINAVNAFPTNVPLLQDVRVAGSELHRLFEWHALRFEDLQVANDPELVVAKSLFHAIQNRVAEGVTKIPASITLQFILRSNFSDLNRFIYTLSERFKSHAPPETTHIPYSYTYYKYSTHTAQFGTLATLGDEQFRVHFEFIVEREDESFSPAESITTRFFGGAVGGVASIEQWMLDNLFKRVDVNKSHACGMEKLLDYILDGYLPTPKALSLFQHEFGVYYNLQALFERRFAGKTEKEKLNELLLILSLLRDVPIENFVPTAEYSPLHLVDQKKLTLAQLFSIEEIFCRLEHTRPRAGCLNDISPTFLQIDPLLLHSEAFVQFATQTRNDEPREVVEEQCDELREAVRTAKMEPHVYLVALALARTGKFQDMIELALTHYPEMAENSPFAKTILKTLNVLLVDLGERLVNREENWTKYLLGCSHPLCKKIGFERIMTLPSDQIKRYIKGQAFDVQLRLIDSVKDTASEADVHGWIQSSPQKALLFETLTKNDDPRWVNACVKVALSDAVTFYPSVVTQKPEVAKSLLVACTSHPEAHTVRHQVVEAWSGRSVDEKKASLPQFLVILLDPESCAKNIQFLCDVLEYIHAGSYSFDRTASDTLRTHFRKLLDILASRHLALLLLVKWHQELCKDALSNLVKGTVRSAYGALTEVPQPVRAWYVANFSENVPPPQNSASRLDRKTVRARCYDAALNPQLFAKIVNEVISLNGSADAVLYNILLEFASLANLQDSFTLLAQPLATIKGINHDRLLQLLYDFTHIINQNLKRHASHIRKIHDWFWQISPSDANKKKLFAWTLLQLCGASNDKVFFDMNARLVVFALDGIATMEIESNSNSPLHAFLEAAKLHYTNPLEVTAVRNLLDTIAPAVERALTHNQKNEHALKLASTIVDIGDEDDKLLMYIFRTNSEALKNKEFFDACVRNYSQSMQKKLEEPDSDVSEAVLSLDLFDVMQLPVEMQPALRGKMNEYSKIITKHFVIYLADHGWNGLSKQFLQLIAATIVEPLLANGLEYDLQECVVQEVTVLTREHYPPVSNSTDFTRVATPILETKKRKSALLPSELAYAQFLSYLIDNAVAYSRDVQGVSRACLLNFAAYTLGMLLDCYPHTAKSRTLLGRFMVSVDENDPLFESHKRVTHSLIELAKSKNVKLDDALVRFASSPGTYPTLAEIENKANILLRLKPQVIQGTLPQLIKDLVQNQQHAGYQPSPDRTRILNQLLDIWASHPSVDKLYEIAASFETLLFPYKNPVDASDIELLYRYFNVFDFFAENEVSFAPLTHITDLFVRLSSSSQFRKHPKAYLTFARAIMERIGPNRTPTNAACLVAINIFSKSIACSFGSVLPDREFIELVTEWMKLVVQLPKELKRVQLAKLINGIAIMGIIPRFQEEQRETLHFWLKTLKTAEDDSNRDLLEVLTAQAKATKLYE